jgi:hypothetical protein
LTTTSPLRWVSFEAVDDRIPRKVESLLGKYFLESLGDLAANVSNAVGCCHIIVFGAVEHFDGLGVVGADVLVDESTDLCFSAFGCKGQKRR